MDAIGQPIVPPDQDVRKRTQKKPLFKSSKAEEVGRERREANLNEVRKTARANLLAKKRRMAVPQQMDRDDSGEVQRAEAAEGMPAVPLGPGLAAVGEAAPLSKEDILKKSKAMLGSILQKQTPKNPQIINKVKTDSFKAILGEGFPGDINESMDTLAKLAFLDSIHDFWNERGAAKKKIVTDEDEEAPDDDEGAKSIEEREARLQAVRDKLVQSIQSYLGIPGKTIEDILKDVTGGVIKTTSTIEDKVLAYFQKNYNPFNEPEQVITVNDVITKWRFKEDYNSNWPGYQAAIRKLPALVEISIDGTRIKSLADDQLGSLGFFILACLDPSKQPGTGDAGEVYLTFDMDPRDIGKIFTRFKQVKNGIFPQNVADSATTSFSALQGRSQFFRADYSPVNPANSKPVTKLALANAFTQDKYSIEFNDTGFGPKNKFGFSINVKDKSDNKIVGTIPFGKGIEQGPSVNYLKDLILAPDDKSRLEIRPKKTEIALLNKLNRFDQSLLFDIKRLGDQEQMRATGRGIYGVTGDRFAGAFRRILRKPGIYHSSSGYRVWRGVEPRGVGPVVVDVKEQAREFRKAQVIEKMRIVSGLLPGYQGSIYNDLLKMYEHVQFGKQNGYVFSKPENVIAGLTGPNALEFVQTKYTQIGSTFATYLLRKRMEDISNHIKILVRKAETIREKIPGLEAAACLFDPKKPLDPEVPCTDDIIQAAKTEAETVKAGQDVAGVPEDTIDWVLGKLEDFLKENEEFEKLNIKFIEWNRDTKKGVAEPIYVQLFDETTGRLLSGAKSSLFNFSAGPFLSSEAGIATTMSRLLFLSKSLDARTTTSKVNKLLVEYFIARDQIKEAFLDETMKQQIEAATDISSGVDTVRLFNPTDDGKRGLFEVILAMAELGEKAEVPVGEAGPEIQGQIEGPNDGIPDMEGNVALQGGKQKGGAASPLQYRDLHDLFVELCLDAKNALEDIPTIEGEDAQLQRARDVVNEMELKWLLEVDDLRNRSEYYYGTLFEESVATDVISFLLSFRTIGDGIQYGQTFSLDDLTIYPNFGNTIGQELNMNTGRGTSYTTTIINDIGGIYLTQVPVEAFIIQVFAGIADQLLESFEVNEDDPTQIITPYAAPDRWNEITNLLYVFSYGTAGQQENLPRELKALLGLQGGGLDTAGGSTPNAPPSSGSSRRRLYQGLRKRSGSGSPSEL